MNTATTGTIPHIAITQVVNAIGDTCFAPTLARFLRDVCGAQHFAAFRLERNEVREVAASCVDPERTVRDRVESYVRQGWWRRDPAMSEAQRDVVSHGPNIIHVDLDDDGYADIRPSMWPDVRDRLMLYGHSADGAFGVSILRSEPHASFADRDIDNLAESAELLLGLLAKHAEMCQARSGLAQGLNALDRIENCILASGVLSRREAEVCARILFGLSSAGIAVDLAVGEETIRTYRKRAYQRLGIGSERELRTWYFARWSQWRGHAGALPAAGSVH